MAVGKSGLGFALSRSKAEQMACSHQTGGFTVRRFLCFELERFRDHFYSSDPPMAVGKSGLGIALSGSIAEQSDCCLQRGGFTIKRFLCFKLERF